MPDLQLHLKKATENENLSSQLDLSKPSAPNWAIIMTFYSAVHYVEAYFAKQGKHFDGHPARGTAIQRDGRIKNIFRPYVRLQDDSERARYGTTFFSDVDLSKRKPNLDEIKKVIAPFL